MNNQFSHINKKLDKQAALLDRIADRIGLMVTVQIIKGGKPCKLMIDPSLNNEEIEKKLEEVGGVYKWWR